MKHQPKKQLYSCISQKSSLRTLDIYTENGEIKLEQFMSNNEVMFFFLSIGL